MADQTQNHPFALSDLQRRRDRPNLLDGIARRLVLGQLHKLRRSSLTIRDVVGETTFGEQDDLQVTLSVHRQSFFRQALLGGNLSVAESYVNGDWDCDNLTGLFRIFLRNREAGNRFDRGPARFVGFLSRILHRWRSNTRRGSQQNIEAHYDLGNEFYRLWLDETMAYSSAIFPSPDASLEQGSTEKFDRICRKLALSPADQVLEIGTGWGGFAIHAATHYGCHVTTSTISPAQFALAQQRINAAEMSNQIHLLQQDYRDLQGSFDKLVSIEMIEAVGHAYLDTYFRQCGKLLRPNGSFVLQAIVMPDRHYARYLKSVDFIQRYIFPGGSLPSLGAMIASVGRTTQMRVVQLEDFAAHYAETLRRWRARFFDKRSEIRELGYSERFLRLWTYYLCYCEAAFEERYISLLQIQLDQPECRRAGDVLNVANRYSLTQSPVSTRSKSASAHHFQSTREGTIWNS